MTLHLLKNPASPVALRMLSAQLSATTEPPVVVLLSSDVPPALAKLTTYRVTESAAPQSNDTISYDRLVSMMFEAEHVITW